MAIFVLTQKKSDEYRWEHVDSTRAPLRWVDENDNAFHGATSVWRLATIGIGSSIAYYLNAMWQVSTRYGYNHQGTVMFGKVDAWHQSQRGDGFINHEWHNIGHWSALGIPRYQEEYLERAQFARENAFHIWRVCQEGGTHVPELVTKIERLGDVLRVTTDTGATHLAAKVVCGVGAGPHHGFGARGPTGPKPTSSDEFKRQYSELADRVVDLDTFMREHPRPEQPQVPNGVKVVVHGTNAGIDAVQRARDWGFDVLFFGSSGTAAWLRGNRLTVSPQDTRLPSANKDGAPVEVVVVKREQPPSVVPTEGEPRVTVTFTGNGTTRTEVVYKYVLALGQDADADGAIGAVLNAGGIKPEDLEPIFDTNQIFGLPYQTVLGLQTKGASWSRGLQIVGAAADALARTNTWGPNIRLNYEEQYKLPTDSMNDEQLAAHIGEVNKSRKPLQQLTLEGAKRARDLRLFRFRKAKSYLEASNLASLMDHQIDPQKVPRQWLSQHGSSTPGLSTPERPAATAISSVLGSAQLGAVRAAMAAMHAMIPDYMLGNDSQANFTTDDRTMLALYIAKNFPSIDPTRANSLVEEIIGARRTSLNRRAEFTSGSVASTDLGFDDDQARSLKELLEDTNQIWKRIHG